MRACVIFHAGINHPPTHMQQSAASRKGGILMVVVVEAEPWFSKDSFWPQSGYFD